AAAVSAGLEPAAPEPAPVAVRRAPRPLVGRAGAARHGTDVRRDDRAAAPGAGGGRTPPPRPGGRGARGAAGAAPAGAAPAGADPAAADRPRRDPPGRVSGAQSRSR